MGFQLDFNQSRSAISRFAQFLQYDLLDKMRSDRDVALVKIQDRLARERAAEAGEIAKETAEFKSALTDKEAYVKAMLDIEKLPEYDYLVSMARLAADPNIPPQYKQKAKTAAQEYAQIIAPLSVAYYNASRGRGSAGDAFQALKGGGSKGLLDWMNQNGMGYRANLQAATEEGKMQTEIFKTKTGATDERAKRYLDLLGDSIKNLQANGVQGTSATGDVAIFMEGKTLNPLSAEDQDKALTGLVMLRQQILDNGPDSLTPGQKNFITNTWNVGAWGPYAGRVAKKTADVGAEGAPIATGGKPTARGGIDPDTGNSDADLSLVYTRMRKTLIAEKTAEAIAMIVGIDPETKRPIQPTADELKEITQDIIEYVDTDLGPRLWANWSSIAGKK